MSAEPRFLTTEEVIVIHRRQIEVFGGASGIRDEGMLESALGRPINRWTYEGGSLPHLAVAYAFGIARNHLFIDGNKRAAFVASYTFLRLNGLRFIADEAEVVVMFLALAAGELEEEPLASWFADRVEPSLT